MALHLDAGRRGEQLAADYLQQQGFTLLHRNWRHGRWEVDLIAERRGRLHFVEVKWRRSSAFGHPESAVDRHKFRCLLGAADAYLYLHPHYAYFQIDIIAITRKKAAPPEIFLIEDVYLP